MYDHPPPLKHARFSRLDRTPWEGIVLLEVKVQIQGAHSRRTPVDRICLLAFVPACKMEAMHLGDRNQPTVDVYAAPASAKLMQCCCLHTVELQGFGQCEAIRPPPAALITWPIGGMCMLTQGTPC